MCRNSFKFPKKKTLRIYNPINRINKWPSVALHATPSGTATLAWEMRIHRLLGYPCVVTRWTDTQWCNQANASIQLALSWGRLRRFAPSASHSQASHAFCSAFHAFCSACTIIDFYFYPGTQFPFPSAPSFLIDIKHLMIKIPKTWWRIKDF